MQLHQVNDSAAIAIFPKHLHSSASYRQAGAVAEGLQQAQKNDGTFPHGRAKSDLLGFVLVPIERRPLDEEIFRNIPS